MSRRETAILDSLFLHYLLYLPGTYLYLGNGAVFRNRQAITRRHRPERELDQWLGDGKHENLTELRAGFGRTSERSHPAPGRVDTASAPSSRKWQPSDTGGIWAGAGRKQSWRRVEGRNGRSGRSRTEEGAVRWPGQRPEASADQLERKRRVCGPERRVSPPQRNRTERLRQGKGPYRELEAVRWPVTLEEVCRVLGPTVGAGDNSKPAHPDDIQSSGWKEDPC